MIFNVDSKVERGLLGVDVLKKDRLTYVFFYITENLAGSSSSTSDEFFETGFMDFNGLVTV